MTFQSVDYLIFFIAVFAVYWALPWRIQNVFLLVASYFFYGYVHPWYLLLLVTQTVISWGGAIAAAPGRPAHRAWLWATVGANLAFLFFYKYFDFFVGNVTSVLAAGGLANWSWSLNVLLPVGISFYTFQLIGYVVDVARGDLAPRRSFINVALFISYFPQLVAGPIERATHFLPQIEAPRRLTVSAARSACSLIIWGLFKKLVVADNTAIIANRIFGIEDAGFGLVWVGVFAFTIQIFADFSAYTDIARGSARLLGFDLMENFANPYLADSPADFWKRWHISLSSWIRDYVYIPLGGSRVSGARAVFNILITFLIFGLWHGAAWNYVLWGLYHGMLTLLYRGARHAAPVVFAPGPVRRAARIAVMFVFTMAGWLIFREHDVSRIAQSLTLSPFDMTADQRLAAAYYLTVTLIYAAPILAHMMITEWMPPRLTSIEESHVLWGFAARTAAAVVLLLAILILSSPVQADFIYFQF